MRLRPRTLRGFVGLAFVVSTGLLALFAATRFALFAFLALIAFLVGVLLTAYAVYERFVAWLGWTQQEQ